MADLIVRSPVFENNKLIPSKYSCDGQEVNPPLTVENIPQGTKTVALIVDDPDAPRGTFDHWIVWNITPSEKIDENSKPGIEGLNGAGQVGYIGM